jgi:hypothetical protein
VELLSVSELDDVIIAEVEESDEEIDTVDVVDGMLEVVELVDEIETETLSEDDELVDEVLLDVELVSARA